jgi:hypothetical protein
LKGDREEGPSKEGIIIYRAYLHAGSIRTRFPGKIEVPGRVPLKFPGPLLLTPRVFPLVPSGFPILKFLPLKFPSVIPFFDLSSSLEIPSFLGLIPVETPFSPLFQGLSCLPLYLLPLWN